MRNDNTVLAHSSSRVFLYHITWWRSQSFYYKNKVKILNISVVIINYSIYIKKIDTCRRIDWNHIFKMNGINLVESENSEIKKYGKYY